MSAAEWIVTVCAIYAAAGVVFAVAFVIAGAGRLDAAARESGTGFRLLIVPGSAALWPLLLIRWHRATRKDPP
jgi:hypothetical protein